MADIVCALLSITKSRGAFLSLSGYYASCISWANLIYAWRLQIFRVCLPQKTNNRGKKNHSTQKQKYHCVVTAAAPQRGNHLKSRRAAYVAACLLMVDGNSSGFSGHSTFLSKDLPHSVCVIHTNPQSVKYFLCTSCTFFMNVGVTQGSILEPL